MFHWFIYFASGCWNEPFLSLAPVPSFGYVSTTLPKIAHLRFIV